MIINRLLVLAPHTDDAELGSGATIARMIEEGVDVHVVAFSIAEESLPPGFPPHTLRDEFLSAVQKLGVAADHARTYNYPVRKLSYHRQELLEELVRLRKEIRPDAVFLPSQHDIHQDHQVLYAEGLRAFKDITIWGYELPWNHVTFSTNVFVTVQPHHLQAKWTAMQEYHSQEGRSYFTWEFVESLARVRGLQIKEQYAEAFEITRLKW